MVVLSSAKLLESIPLAPPGAARDELVRLYTRAKFVESLPRASGPALTRSTLASPESDVESLAAGGDVNATHWKSRGWLMVVSRVLGGFHVVVVRDESVRVPRVIESLPRWSVAELRAARGLLYGGPAGVAEFVTLHLLKQELSGRIVGSDVVLRRVVSELRLRGCPVGGGCPCGDGSHRRCQGVIPHGEFLAVVVDTLDPLVPEFLACLPCAWQYEWSERARREEVEWFKAHGAEL